MAFHRCREGFVVVSGALPPEHTEPCELEQVPQLGVVFAGFHVELAHVVSGWELGRKGFLLLGDRDVHINLLPRFKPQGSVKGSLHIRLPGRSCHQQD